MAMMHFCSGDRLALPPKSLLYRKMDRHLRGRPQFKEQMLPHSKSSSKCLGRVHWLVNEVVLHKLLMNRFAILVNYLPFRCGGRAFTRGGLLDLLKEVKDAWILIMFQQIFHPVRWIHGHIIGIITVFKHVFEGCELEMRGYEWEMVGSGAVAFSGAGAAEALEGEYDCGKEGRKAEGVGDEGEIDVEVDGGVGEEEGGGTEDVGEVGGDEEAAAWGRCRHATAPQASLCSEAFTIGGCKCMRIYIDAADHLSMFLDVADAAALPDGWCRDAKLAFTLDDQENGEASTAMGAVSSAVQRRNDQWGFAKFKRLNEFHDRTKGYVVDDTVVVEVDITLLEVVPAVVLATQIGCLDSYFSNLSKYFNAAGTSRLGERLASDMRTLDLASGDDVEMAKHSLEECLSDLFNLNMTNKLSSALSILSHARAGLSPDQKRAIKKFKINFADFVSDYLTFEQDNSDFELQKITWDHLYSTMKNDHETHLSQRPSLDSLANEKEELKKRLKEVSAREMKLISECETLMNKSEEVKSRFAIQDK
ncbi:hypothetical protein CRG98_042473 [Punica granatum]|uniref:MATH domain-containing protein n=2 Tax=Punica granatum TaxID=22663 RepID=A0A2I0HZL3_PUNGR|nr:hypothetical protein CRG98_042473 [Punica granatum]